MTASEGRYAELEIALERSGTATGPSGPDVLTAQLRVDRPGSEAEDRVTVQELTLDRSKLAEKEHDPAAYGQLLTDLLFRDADLRAAFTRAREGGGRLRIRLSFGPGAADLQDLKWERLRDPDRPGAPLLTDQAILFSRYLSSFDWRPVRLRPRESLRALVFVAGPIDHAARGFAEVKTADELKRAREHLAGLDLIEVASDPFANPPRRASLERLLEALREGPDILYLVCHGALDRSGQPTLFLDDAEGNTARVRGADVVGALHDLEQRPRLVVLASCESAGAGEALAADGLPLVALGPRLAEAGIGAVLAMQGRVAMRTVAEFMPVFFRELVRDGVIDRALAVARGSIRDAKEASRPVLFMRLKHGRVWYDAGFGAGTLGNWDAIGLKIEDRECTPIIGPGLLETLFEYRSWLARRWAQEYFFPLSPAQREDLTAVAQYLASKQGADFPHKKLIRDLPVGLEQRVSPGPAGAPRPLIELLAALRRRRFAGRGDPYAILADLPLPVFILASPDPLLVHALRERGKKPQEGVLPWRRGVKDPLAGRRDYEPSPEEPLVYHLFGTFDTPRSLVVTQDDYVDFLLNINRTDVRDDIPKVVLERLVDSSLLFLGFSLDSWEFRAVFRAIMQQEGMESSLGPHVAAQIDPEEGRVLDPGGARTYFERYLRGARIDVYWGTAEGFLADLDRHLRGGPR